MRHGFSPSKAVISWLWLGILMILFMVVIGGLTRLTHSGLSMVHWTFAGSLPPMEHADWIQEFHRYQESPEFKELHSHFDLNDFKSIYWWEYIHRMFGRLIGIVFIIPFIFFTLTKRIPKAMLPQFFIILALGAAQALLGWFMVKSGLIDVPRVSHFRLAAHLTTAFITCSYILWVTINYSRYGYPKMSVKTPRIAGIVGFGLLLLTQIIYGGFVAGLKAGWVHNTWPLMDGQLIAESATVMDPLIMNFLMGKSGVQFMHRTLGILVLSMAIWLLVKYRDNDTLKRPVYLLMSCITVQFILGVLTLLLEVPIELGIIHQVFALVTLLSFVWLLHRSVYGKPLVAG